MNFLSKTTKLKIKWNENIELELLRFCQIIWTEITGNQIEKGLLLFLMVIFYLTILAKFIFDNLFNFSNL